MKHHLELAGKKLEEHEKKFVEQEKKTAVIEKRTAEQETKITEQETKIAEQEARITEQETKITEQEAKITEQETKMAEQAKKTEEQVKKISELKEKLESTQREHQSRMTTVERNIEKLINRSSFEKSKKSFLWTIHDVQRRLTHQMKINSEPFYLHGYRIHLSISVRDPIRRANGTLGVGFCITQGKLDDELEWPFRRTLKLTVANCKNFSDHSSDMVLYLMLSRALSRPTREYDSQTGDYANLFLPRFYDGDKTLTIKCEFN